MVACEKSLMMIRVDDGRTVVLGYLPDDDMMISFLYSLDIPHNELSSVPIAKEYLVVFEEVAELFPHRQIELCID